MNLRFTGNGKDRADLLTFEKGNVDEEREGREKKELKAPRLGVTLLSNGSTPSHKAPGESIKRTAKFQKLSEVILASTGVFQLALNLKALPLIESGSGPQLDASGPAKSLSIWIERLKSYKIGLIWAFPMSKANWKGKEDGEVRLRGSGRPRRDGLFSPWLHILPYSPQTMVIL